MHGCPDAWVHAGLRSQAVPDIDPRPFFETGAFGAHVLGLQAHTDTTQLCAVLGMRPGFHECQANVLLSEQHASVPSGRVLFLPQGLSLSLH